ncbi:1-acyl-sn-glycerol-3-phosphate acyltransferase [Kutzneria viridogrisea]|uniref:1-acyl-sn-glycerol-3-phosphate acyltransferase n=1 Tax=Kutzneria viridogrisea TaxID=47990 RepID=A0ABR6BGU3_9PSEU|nr:1-acyl-sn-glycerol-3-phosphate acyltransferase [Kutzneria viridogrisea]
MSGSTHAWMPKSPCGPSCVSGPVPRVSWLRGAWRACTALTVLLCGISLVLLAPVLRGRLRGAIRFWFATFLRAIGLRVRVHGDRRIQSTEGRGVLVVTNHVSWLDALVVDAVQPMPMVAKRDIADWPVLGPLVSAAGSVFLDRERLTRLPETIAALTAALRDGVAIGANPEGTTWCGMASGHFKPALFQAALDAGVPVRPVALRYRLADGSHTPAAAFVGDEDLVTSIRRVLRIRHLVVEVHVLPEIAPGRAEGRRALAALAESAVASALEVPIQRELTGHLVH